MIKCESCGFENEENASYCHRCGVNIKTDDAKRFEKNVEVLNDEFKVVKKKPSYPAPPEDSLKAKLMYKRDKYTGEMRLAKTKCATLVVFFGFGIFGFLISSVTIGVFAGFIAGILFGLIFAIPVSIIGFVLGKVIDAITH
ncbi:hypothetical protein [Methanobrevibacter millerae]|uniref:Zinc-ribbon domain-containing protein n=1 Tax=Methanobrevibacter millerae TaxID=230361 RepID=A0A1G5VKA8_9EURY|nr:hypothetical protein [Methanobrevibacter millerae]SDA46351.1 hypothetical protein SAMN02910315_00701 [Methanobrevibacter millerae]